MTEITIPAGVISIGDSAFKECKNLTSVTFENNSQLSSIGDSAFSNCTELTSIEIPAGVTSIGDSAFFSCDKLTSIIFEDNSQLSSIGNSAFNSCWDLETITIPNSVTSIGNSAFSNCTELTSIEIPKNVISIEDSTFNACSKLNNVTFEENSQLDTIEQAVFWESNNLAYVFLENDSTIDLSEAMIKEGTNIWRYEVMTPASESSDGKTHVNIAAVTNPDGQDATFTEQVSLSYDEMGDGYIIDSLGENIPDEVILLKLGDINADGNVDIIDLQMLYNHLANVKILEGEKYQRAMAINNDNKIDVLDLKDLFNIIANN